MSIQGTLEDMGVVELLQMPVRERKTGLLSIDHDGETAELAYRQGVLTYAHFQEWTGDEAVYEVLGWNEGGFTLDFKEVEKPGNIKTKIENLIMEGIRRLDEKKREKESNGSKDGKNARLQVFIDEMLDEDDNLIFAGITNDGYSNIVEKQEREEIPVALEQGIAIMLQWIRESTSHVKDDPVEIFMTQSQTYTILSHGLKRELYLIIASKRDVPLGELLLRVRSAVDGLNKRLESSAT